MFLPLLLEMKGSLKMVVNKSCKILNTYSLKDQKVGTCYI